MNLIIFILMTLILVPLKTTWAGGGFPLPKITQLKLGTGLTNIRMATLFQNGTRLLLESDTPSEKNILLDYDLNHHQFILKKPLGSDNFFLESATLLSGSIIEGLAFGSLSDQTNTNFNLKNLYHKYTYSIVTGNMEYTPIPAAFSGNEKNLKSTWGVLSGNGQVFAGTVTYSDYTSEFVTYDLKTKKTTELKTPPGISPFQFFTSFGISKNGEYIGTIAQPVYPNLPGYFVASQESPGFIPISIPGLSAVQATAVNPDRDVAWATFQKPSDPMLYLMRIKPKTKSYQQGSLPAAASSFFPVIGSEDGAIVAGFINTNGFYQIAWVIYEDGAFTYYQNNEIKIDNSLAVSSSHFNAGKVIFTFSQSTAKSSNTQSNSNAIIYELDFNAILKLVDGE